MRYHVKHDFNKYNFRQWKGTKSCEVFGEDNEGIFIDANSLEEVKGIIEGNYGLNPFYCLIFAPYEHPNNRR